MEKKKAPKLKNNTPKLQPEQLKRLESDQSEKLKHLKDRNVVNK